MCDNNQNKVMSVQYTISLHFICHILEKRLYMWWYNSTIKNVVQVNNTGEQYRWTIQVNSTGNHDGSYYINLGEMIMVYTLKRWFFFKITVRDVHHQHVWNHFSWSGHLQFVFNQCRVWWCILFQLQITHTRHLLQHAMKK